MSCPRLYRAQSLQIGLGFLAFAFIVVWVTGLAGDVIGAQYYFAYVLVAVPAGLLRFVFLVVSTFLPVGKGAKPNFTKELMGREWLQYGVYTEGNWMSVLDEKADERKKRRSK